MIIINYTKNRELWNFFKCLLMRSVYFFKAINKISLKRLTLSCQNILTLLYFKSVFCGDFKMNRAKKADSKKLLVRNTQQPVPRTKFIVEKSAKSSSKQEIVEKGGASTSREKSQERLPNLSVPELNSTLAIAKKIDAVEKTKSKKFQSSSELAFDEKVTRQVNFPYDKAIYKDLIPLEVPVKRPQIVSSRAPLPLKDKEPQLLDYVTKKSVEGYVYEPEIELPNACELPKLNNLRIYKLLQM